MKLFVLMTMLFSMFSYAASNTATGTTAKPKNNEATQLDDLLRGEMAAVKSYDTAMKDMKAGAEKNRLMGIRNDHQNSVDVLSKYAAGKPDILEDTESSGAWGSFASAWTRGGKLLGNEAALKALQTGEEHGIREYKEALNDDSIDQNLKSKIKSELLPRQEKHIESLKTFM